MIYFGIYEYALVSSLTQTHTIDYLLNYADVSN